MFKKKEIQKLLETFENLPSELRKEFIPHFSEKFEFYKKGISFDEWKEYATKNREELENSSCTMLGILEGQWNRISYHDLKRDEYYALRDSPLEILHFCMADDLITYPPPEILWVIAKQFQWYMEKEGDITLEEAFFGKPIKSKGNYAKRMADETKLLYEAFHRKLKATPTISQPELLEKICISPPSDNNQNDALRKIYEKNQANENFQDSFLRGYRRWKEKNADN